MIESPFEFVKCDTIGRENTFESYDERIEFVSQLFFDENVSTVRSREVRRVEIGGVVRVKELSKVD